MRRFLLALGMVLTAGGPVVADTAIPERRLVITRDVDYYGADLQAVFDTTIDACQKICLDNAECQAFTFNARSNACFPKSEVTDRQPYEDAVSGRVVEVGETLLRQANDRALDLVFVGQSDLDKAYKEAAFLARRHGGGQWTPQALLDAADKAYAAGNFRDAIHWVGSALAQSDEPPLWLRYGQWSSEYAEAVEGADQRKYRQRAYLASINAYLRASEPDHLMEALRDMAVSLEKDGRGRDMIPALRLAEFYGERADVTELLDKAIGKYGFRIREHTMEADSADPRICVSFTENLIRAGQDYAPFVRLPDPRMAVTADDQQICVTGVEHGGRYTLTFRSGLPADNGERLVRNVDITAYVRDRSPKIGFPGRAYVLPRSADAGLPIETVNLDTVDLVLRRVSDRNLLRAMQESYFGNPLSRYEEQYVAEDIAEEIWRGTGEVENTLNTDMLTRLPMGDVVGDLPAGIYALTAGIPGRDEYDENRTTQWFVLSDIGLTSLQGNDGLTVFARGLGNAAPLSGLEVTLVSSANRELQTVTSDAAGIARFDPGLLRGAGSSRAALIVAKQGEDDIAFLSLTDPGFDLSDRGVAGREPAGPIDTFLTTDRSAYRVGEVIHATALLRDAKVAAVPDLALTAVLNRPDGVEYARYVSDGGLDGGHVFTMPLAPTSPRGTWRLEIYSDPNGEPLASNTVLVEDFVPERIDFDLTLPEGAINPLDAPELGVEARYLFGAIGADLPIEGELIVTSQTRLEAFPKYRFGRYDEESFYRTNSFAADLKTGADGTVDLALPFPDLSSSNQPMQARAVLRMSEGSGRPVERSITRAVAPAVPIIGVRPLFEDSLPEGAEARFDVIAVGPDLTPQTMEVSWQVNRVRTRYQWYQQYGRWNWEPITTRTSVARGEGLLGTDPLRVSADVEWGEYEIVVERTDGTYLASSMQFDAGWYAPADAAETPDMLELSLNKPSYGPGDTATLRMVPRYAGKALVTVLSDRVVSMQAIDVVEGENTLDLPVTEDWGAGVYVTAQVIRPMDVTAGQNPARALGLAHASVDPGERKLDVSIDVLDEVSPRGPLKAAVQIEGLAGQTAHVTVAAVDLGILNLTAFQSPDPAGHYFGQRRLGVDIRDIYGRLIDGSNGAMGAIRSGGDAAAGMSLQSPPPTEDLVAFFSGPVTVDETGRAEVEFQLPDFNGTVRLMAVAWSPKAVGQAEADVVVRDPVVLSASLPRFLAPGDTSRLLLELTHTKGEAGEMPLNITANGVDLAGPAPVAVVLDEGAKRTIEVPIAADQIGDHTIRIALTTPSGQVLTKDLKLGVRANDPAVGATRRLSLASGETFTLDRNIFAGLRPAEASALVSAGPLARFDAPGLLEALDRYPYGCTEQVTSQAMPLLYMSAIAEPLGLGNKGKIDLRVQQSITKILTRQAPSGGFGLWRAYAGDFWLDAYVTDFLGRARAAGYEVPALAWRNALDNLRNRIAYAPDFDQGGEDIAYALMVLAREGEAAMGDLRYYADERSEAFSTTLARAQLGAALASYGDQPRADRMFASAQSHLPSNIWEAKRQYRVDYGSYMRDTAGLLSLAVEARSDAVDREALTRHIGEANRPLSTQEQAWALLAAHALVQDPTVSGLAVNGVELAGPFVRKYEAQGLDPIQITNTGTAPTDITVTTLGLPEGEVEATGYGYQISRDYYRMDGTTLEGDIRVGDRMVAVLTVRPGDKTRARLMVNDPLPAGFEIDNPNLLRSGDLRALDWLDPSTTEHAEFRSDRFMAAVNQSGDRRIQLAYILRAVSPGEFHHPAALVEDMYRPDYRATTASGRVTILP